MFCGIYVLKFLLLVEAFPTLISNFNVEVSGECDIGTSRMYSLDMKTASFQQISYPVLFSDHCCVYMHAINSDRKYLRVNIS